MRIEKIISKVKRSLSLNSEEKKQSNLEERKKKLIQIRTDALSAEYIYSKELSMIGRITNSITCLTILVPIITTFSLVLSKGSDYEKALNLFSFISAGLLLCLSIWVLIFKYDHKRESYLIGRRANINISNESHDLISDPAIDPKWFYKYVSEQDAKDQENVNNVAEKTRQEAYRHTLKKLHPSESNVVCSVCAASPYIFKKGNCQLCGNTPIK